MSKVYDVFISYSSNDQKIAEGICGYLERKGYRCFVSYRDIPRGLVWATAITEAIDASLMMIVVFSQSFNVSPQTDREIELASENHIPILTYRVADTKMTGAKKYYLKNLNWIDAFPIPENYFGQLYASVVRLIGLSALEDGLVKQETEKNRSEKESLLQIEKEHLVQEQRLKEEKTQEASEQARREQAEKASLYNGFVTEANRLYKCNALNEARMQYRYALNVVPSDSYAIKMIAQIDKQMKMQMRMPIQKAPFSTMSLCFGIISLGLILPGLGTGLFYYMKYEKEDLYDVISILILPIWVIGVIGLVFSIVGTSKVKNAKTRKVVYTNSSLLGVGRALSIVSIAMCVMALIFGLL